ncbi:unnamed protein product [Echinostoma caproni]|uniref:PH domain-containing protein n=1 Tax=Echinostoma caproni TaxID=27848 RepID=A0A183ACB9_9TREM|nr:unnamed protein product [Echinostoma caproni]
MTVSTRDHSIVSATVECLTYCLAQDFNSAFRRLKGSQRLWHAFEEATFCLVAFRTEEEASVPNKEPLKSISIPHASFSVDPNEMNQFIISVDGRDHILQAETEEAMFMWLGALQVSVCLLLDFPLLRVIFDNCE